MNKKPQILPDRLRFQDLRGLLVLDRCPGFRAMDSLVVGSEALALCPTSTTVSNAARRFRIGPAKNKYVYEPKYEDVWMCAIHAAGWDVEGWAEPARVVLWIIVNRQESSVIAFHAPDDCCSKEEVLRTGSPVFMCENDKSVMEEGYFEWQCWDGPRFQQGITPSGEWRDLASFKTTLLP